MNERAVSRRAFLAVGAAATLPPMRAEKPASGGVRFGVRSPLPKTGLRERAALVRRLGYDGIELGPEWLDQPLETIQEQLQGTGAAVSAIVGSIGLLDADAQKRERAVELDRRRLRMAQMLGAAGIIEVPCFGPNPFPDLSPVMTAREVEDRLLEAELKMLAPAVQAAGIPLLLEPCNRKETHYMNRQDQAAGVIEALGERGFGILSDFYHMQLEETDIGATLRRCGKYTAYVHLADGEKRTEPGSLPFDYRPGFRELKRWGYNGWLTVESGATDNPEAALARALEYLKRQWQEA